MFELEKRFEQEDVEGDSQHGINTFMRRQCGCPAASVPDIPGNCKECKDCKE